MMNFFNGVYRLFAICLLLVVFVGGWFWMQYNAFLGQSLLPFEAQAVVVEFLPGQTIRQFANQLQARGALSSALYFELMTRFKGVSTQLRAGEYVITPGLKPATFLKHLEKGQVVMHQIIFIEGWTFHDMLTELAGDPNVKHTLTNLSPEQVRMQLSIKKATAEGLFFPDTYQFPKGTSDIKILKNAQEKMQQNLAALWETREANLIYRTPYEALIAASLIEKETHLARERTLISGVLVRRLRKRMPLQIDAAVVYGLGPYFKPPLNKANLRKKTPYNTYIHRGLPPTPIAMPSQASLWAAMHPAVGDMLYFVAKGDGSHIFSETLREHNRAVNEYIRHEIH